MKKKFIDLSVSLQQGIKSDPDFMLPKINYHHHDETSDEMISFFSGLKKTLWLITKKTQGPPFSLTIHIGGCSCPE